jgi:hypothetical protein
VKIGKKFFAESDFRDRVWGILQKSNPITAKIVFFDPKSDFCKKKFANIFAMSAAVGLAKKDDFRGITAKNADQKQFFSNFVGLAPYP